jgi:hypothetical protein
MEIEKLSDKNFKQQVEYLNSFNFSKSDLENMTLEDFINLVYNRTVIEILLN